MVNNMININLFKKEFKNGFMLFVIFLGVILLYGIIVASMFSPDETSQGWLEEVMNMFPGLMDAMGFNIESLSNYQSFVAGYLYGMLFIMFGLIFTILLTNRLIFKPLDSGSFVYIHSSCNKRSRIIITEILVIITYLFIMALVMFLTISIAGYVKYAEYVNFGELAYLNLSFFTLLVFISSITIFTSSLFEGKLAMGLNVGLPVFFFLFKMISNLGEKYDLIKYFTPFSLFDPESSIHFSINSIVFNIVLIVASFGVFIINIVLFKKKDLSI